MPCDTGDHEPDIEPFDRSLWLGLVMGQLQVSDHLRARVEGTLTAEPQPEPEIIMPAVEARALPPKQPAWTPYEQVRDWEAQR